MADEQGITPAQTKTEPVLTEIAAKFSSRFPDFRCSVCGAEDFFIIDKGEEFSSRLIIYTGTEKDSIAHFTTTTLACTTCGHLYQFLTDLLSKAIIERDNDSPALP